MPTVLGKAPEGKPRGRPKKTAEVVGCRPEDRAMLSNEAGKELVAKAFAAMGEVGSEPSPATPYSLVESSDPLDAFTEAGAERALQLTLWLIRHEHPEGLKVTEQDIAKLKACTDHLKVKPMARVWRRAALPAHNGAPAVGNRRAIAPFAGMPAAPFATIQLVDATSKDAFRLMENNEEDNEHRIAVEKRNQAKTAMPGLIGAVRSALARGETSDSLINELCEASAALARLP